MAPGARTKVGWRPIYHFTSAPHFTEKSKVADFHLAVTKTLRREGGSTLTDDPLDKGGLTKYGISQKAYPHEDIRNLSEERAKELYKQDYWDRIGGDRLSNQQLGEALFDTAVHMGVSLAMKLAQRVVRVADDGIMGVQTLAALNLAGENPLGTRVFLAEYPLAKIAYYIGLCKKEDSQKKFLLGWISRTLESVS